MDDDAVPPTRHDDDSYEKSQMGYETGSPVATTYTPATKIERKSRKAVGSVMISHLSVPPIHFREGDEGNPRNWDPKRKISVGVFVIVAGFVASVPILLCTILELASFMLLLPFVDSSLS